MNTPPPRSPGLTGPPRASSEIHSVPTGGAIVGQPILEPLYPARAETIGSESLPAVGAGAHA
jgi:hypothetical protein